MTYTQSLDNIMLCERNLMNCEDAEHTTQNDYLQAFDAFQQAKDYHRAQFGAPTKRNGEWA